MIEFDRHAGHADVAGDARIVAVVAPVRRQVERHRQTLLSGGQVAAIEGVGVLGGGEAGVLPDRPGPGHVHRRVRSTQVGRQARHGVEMVETFEIPGGVQRLHRQPLRRLPDERLRRLARLVLEALGPGGIPVAALRRQVAGLQLNSREVGKSSHRSITPRRTRVERVVCRTSPPRKMKSSTPADM